MSSIFQDVRNSSGLRQRARSFRALSSLAVAAAGLMLVVAAPASAEFVAYTGVANPPFTIPPLQSWGGSLGMDFTVNSAINVDSMGVYNAAGNGSISGTLLVAIFQENPDNSWSIVPGTYATFTSAAPGLPDLVNDGQYDLYKAISPVLLDPGTYSVVAVGFSQSDPNGNTGFQNGIGALETGSPDITYIGSARFNNNPSQNGLLVFPTTVDGGPSNRYDAGTFEFSDATPEPSTWLLAVAGLFAVGIRRRKTSRTML